MAVSFSRLFQTQGETVRGWCLELREREREMVCMRKKIWIFQSLLMVECYLGMWIFQSLLMVECYLASAIEAVQEKAESTVPITTLSPPEGNTTFLEGTTWCVALAGASQADLQNALDWACGLGMADCSSIQKDGVCYEPDTLLSHASFAFNSYYQQNGDSDIACNFGGTATLTRRDPSYGSCAYSTSGPAASSSPPLWIGRSASRELLGLLLLIYLMTQRPLPFL